MRKPVAAIGSAVFFVAAPCVVVGLIPWWLTGWEIRQPVQPWWPIAAVGALLLAASAAVLIHAFARFVVEGVGTPAPVAPTRHLVVGGLYSYVRNPMYLAVVGAIVGQALLLGQLGLLGYAIVVAMTIAAFAHAYEEPTLIRQFGEEYEAYRRAVPAWLPRLRPWRPDDRRPDDGRHDEGRPDEDSRDARR
jgi:protein-S-isoprenylcysteine O-methyltransferase Ste14